MYNNVFAKTLCVVKMQKFADTFFPPLLAAWGDVPASARGAAGGDRHVGSDAEADGAAGHQDRRSGDRVPTPQVRRAAEGKLNMHIISSLLNHVKVANEYFPALMNCGLT